MIQDDEIGIYLVIWILLFALTLFVTFRRRNTVGLTAGFLMTFLANHWLASVFYALPGRNLYPTSVVVAGLKQSVLGMAAFAFGVLVLAPLVTGALGQRTTVSPSADQLKRNLPRQIWLFFLIGSVSYFMAPILRFPVLDVIMRETSRLAVLAGCLFIYLKIQAGQRNVWAIVLLIAALFALVELIYGGFASYGTVIGIAFITFYLSQSRIDFRKILLLPLVAYIGLSAFAVYLDYRGEIRSVIWGGESLDSRINVIWDTASKFELFTTENQSRLNLVDYRLNRNYYVGKAVERLDSGAVDYAMGQSLVEAIIAPIPRVLWPDKPVISGGSQLFTKFTGIPTTSQTSSGVGVLLESYVNFGSAGVVVMFALCAVVLAIFDGKSRNALETGQYATFAIWFLAGIEMVDPIDYIAGVVGAIVSSFLVLTAFFAVFKALRRDVFERPVNPMVSINPSGEEARILEQGMIDSPVPDGPPGF